MFCLIQNCSLICFIVLNINTRTLILNSQKKAKAKTNIVDIEEAIPDVQHNQKNLEKSLDKLR